jgi:LuxR family transcriptional regulator, maltose regulon positive regulatory protein
MKIEPPLLAPSSITRPALMARLDAASKLRLVVVAAPSGSGKTTLLTQWFRRSRQRRVAAWLSLSAPDGPRDLAAQLWGSLASATAAELSSEDDPAQALQALLAHRSGDLLIVIDDVDLAQDVPCLRLIDNLLGASTPGVHWVVSGRCLPGLNLSTWRLRDQLEVLDGADLAFDANQVVQLGRKLMDDPPTRTQAERLLAATQGWAAGVKLGLLVAARGHDIDAALADFDGGHVEMAAYLDAEVLRGQPPALRDFLISTSAVDTMTGELCDALLGQEQSQAVLEQLERSQLFVTAQDSHGHAFRYHPLFHGFLRSRLAADPAGQRALHESASRWYAGQLLFAEALVHAFASGRLAWCAELVERAALRWQRAGDIAEVVRWSERLTLEMVVQRPALGVAYATCLAISRRFDQARAVLRRLGDEHARTGMPSAFQLRTLQEILLVLSGEHEALADEPLVPDDTGDDAHLRGLQLVNRAYALFRSHRFDQAWRQATRAREILQPISPYGVGYASSVLALVERAKGDFGSAVRRVEQLWAGMRNGPRNAAWANAATSLALVRYESNRLAEARSLCEEVLPLLEAGGTHETLVTATRTLARVLAAGREHEAAMRLLDYLHGVIEGSHERRFAGQVCGDKVRLWLAMGQPARARQCAAEFGVRDASDWQAPRPYDEAWERRGMALAAILSHEARHDEARAILDVLHESAEAASYVLRLHAIEAALASCLWDAGAREEALRCLHQALVRAHGHAPSRSWFDDNPHFHLVLVAALQVPQMRRLMPAHVLKVFGAALGRGEGQRSKSANRACPAVDALTSRELEVLVLLAQGLSNQQISTRAQISLTTVKWHVKNIFAKLGVSTRVGALVRARELRLIEWGDREAARPADRR